MLDTVAAREHNIRLQSSSADGHGQAITGPAGAPINPIRKTPHLSPQDTQSDLQNMEN